MKGGPHIESSQPLGSHIGSATIRNSAGSMPAPPISGRLPIAPRWSIDPPAKHVMPPPPPTPSRRKRKSGSSGSGRKNSLGERAAKVRGADMKEDLQQAAMDCASDAIDQCDGEKEIAEYIKKEFDKKHGSTWHCIVGRNFGSYVTHEADHFVYISQGKVAVLLFKAG